MKQLYPDLWQTDAETRFGSLTAHAYLLELNEEHRVLLYTTSREDELQRIAGGGPVAYQYLSHCHEVDESLGLVRATLGSKLCCHSRVEPYFKEEPGADIYFSAAPCEQHGGLEILHTPGHTSSNVCYLYRSPHGKRYLFVGDTLYQDHGQWATLIVSADGGAEDELRASLQFLRQLDVDVVICSVSIGETEVTEVTRKQWHRVVDGLTD